MHGVRKALILLFSAAVSLLAPSLVVRADYKIPEDYKIPDDCLGDWEYCNSLWMGDFDRFGSKAFASRPLPPLPGALGCRAGSEFLLQQGFSNIRTLDCRAPAYVYLARWEGHRVRIRVGAHSGRILNISLP